MLHHPFLFTKNPTQITSINAHVKHRLWITQPTFLVICLSLVLDAANRSITHVSTPGSTRNTLVDFFSSTHDRQPHVYHISREINGIAHNVTHQLLRSSLGLAITCFASAHRKLSCPIVSLVSSFTFQGYVLHVVRCY
ncbi:hypothetical protein ZWY2020_039201 [Hordeum vulgare]|nr:hypothetical protein ZWY2020_039201 [Hordeum vulgare]